MASYLIKLRSYSDEFLVDREEREGKSSNWDPVLRMAGGA
jgi:hypothetical protein